MALLQMKQLLTIQEGALTCRGGIRFGKIETVCITTYEEMTTESIRERGGGGGGVQTGTNLAELGAVAPDELVCGDHHIEPQRLHLSLILTGALLLVTHIVHTPHLRKPLGELRFPIDQDLLGHDDEVGPIHVLVLHQESKQGHHLATEYFGHSK